MTEGAKRGRTKDGEEGRLEKPKSARGVALEPLLATPERRRWPSWLTAQRHIPDLEGTSDPDFFELHENGKLFRLCR